MNPTTRARIERLEAAIEGKMAPESAPEELQRWEDACERLAMTMDAAHLAIVLNEPTNPLTSEFYHRVDWHLRYGKPLALPRPVAGIYLTKVSGDSIVNLADCKQCGYEMPVKHHPYTGRDSIEGRPPKAPTTFFDNCPLCRERL